MTVPIIVDRPEDKNAPKSSASIVIEGYERIIEEELKDASHVNAEYLRISCYQFSNQIRYATAATNSDKIIQELIPCIPVRRKIYPKEQYMDYNSVLLKYAILEKSGKVYAALNRYGLIDFDKTTHLPYVWAAVLHKGSMTFLTDFIGNFQPNANIMYDVIIEKGDVNAFSTVFKIAKMPFTTLHILHTIWKWKKTHSMHERIIKLLLEYNDQRLLLYNETIGFLKEPPKDHETRKGLKFYSQSLHGVGKITNRRRRMIDEYSKIIGANIHDIVKTYYMRFH